MAQLPASVHLTTPVTPRPLRMPGRHATRPRAAACLLALAAAWLAGCGGAADPDTVASESETTLNLPTIDVEGRSFALWTEAQQPGVQAEQLALDPENGAHEVRLIVRLNPAAVLQGDRMAAYAAGPSASAAGGAGTGESGDAAARQAQRLAAKTAAVASAAQSVLERSVLQRAPQAQVRQQFSHALEAFVVSVPWSEAQGVADALARDPAVDSVELDRPLVLQQGAPAARVLDARAWGVDRIDQRQRSFDQQFRSATSGSGVSVYVVDTGISPHNQFGTRLRGGFSAVADGRGTRDCHGHGTHVAGTAAGTTLGVAPGAQLVPVRVMDCQGRGAGSTVLAGMDWVAAQGSRPGVVNMSLGGPASESIDAAARRLLAAGFTVVAAAGNSRIDACTQSPARAPGVLAVGATDSNDLLASYSNTGACLALLAPGSQITAAGVASADAVVTMSGTSMAAPHAAGAAALLLQAQPAATPAQVVQRLRQQATADVVTGVPAGTPRALLYAGSEGSATPPPALPSVRSHSLTMSSQVPAIGSWTARTLVRAVNQAGQPVAHARVLGRYSHMAADVACTTAPDGTCTLSSASAPWGAVSRIGFALGSIGINGMAYNPDGAVRAQIAQPPAPVASVAAISGTMVRSAVTSPSWRPSFAVTVLDTARAGVAAAEVRGLVTIHNGGQPVAQQILTCRTGSAGQCKLDWQSPTLGASHTGARLQVLGVSRPYLEYRAGPLTGATLGRVQ
jgi:subtilisin family serine protease